MQSIAGLAADLATTSNFSGVVMVRIPGEPLYSRAWGLADRRSKTPNTAGTGFSIASGTKGFTALATLSVVESGLLELDTPVRTVLGDALPLIDDRVTVQHLLSHRSGIGDYLDESELTDINAYAMPVPVHQLAKTEDYLTVLPGHPQVSAPGVRFAYNNSGFVVLALVLERITGERFEDIIHERVCIPAEMGHTGFVRSDELTENIAIGYLEPHGLRTNVFHLPVMGSGDGGIVTTAADIFALWTALFNNRIVSAEAVSLMTEPRSEVPDEAMRYGLGLWLHAVRPAVILTGYDAGVSFHTTHDPTTGATFAVMANTSSGAWPIARELEPAVSRWFG